VIGPVGWHYVNGSKRGRNIIINPIRNMSLKTFVDAGDTSSPHFVCDACGLYIQDLANANSTFDDDGNGGHFHKGCDHYPDQIRFWHPLEIDLVYLLVDVGFLTPNGKPTEAMSAIEKAKLLGGDW
jgi:hypothetical protein